MSKLSNVCLNYANPGPGYGSNIWSLVFHQISQLKSTYELYMYILASVVWNLAHFHKV